MYIRYDDILRRIPEPPVWWLNGVPRYDAFAPDAVDVYAEQVALVHSECACGARYDVAMYSGGQGWPLRARLAFYADAGVGDPPNAGCCRGSASDTSYELAVLQFWERDASAVPYVGWYRVPTLEQPLRDVNRHGDTDVPTPASLPDRLQAENLWQRYEDLRERRDRAGLIRLFRQFEPEQAEQLADLVIGRHGQLGL